jgi:hypothetical protein
MNRMPLFVICLCLLCAGCVDQKGDKSKISSSAKEPLSITVTSPPSGAIISGNKDIKFESFAKGGDKPYDYRWFSNMDGLLSTESSFTRSASKLHKGEHYIIIKVTDASGNSSEATALLRLF